MLRIISTRVQTVVVIVLFAASLGALLFNTFSTWLDPEREHQIREQLRDASRRMMEAVPATVVEKTDHGDEDEGRVLQGISRRILADYPGVEGGFYFADSDRFGDDAMSVTTGEPPIDTDISAAK